MWLGGRARHRRGHRDCGKDLLHIIIVAQSGLSGIQSNSAVAGAGADWGLPGGPPGGPRPRGPATSSQGTHMLRMCATSSGIAPDDGNAVRCRVAGALAWDRPVPSPAGHSRVGHRSRMIHTLSCARASLCARAHERDRAAPIHCRGRGVRLGGPVLDLRVRRFQQDDGLPVGDTRPRVAARCDGGLLAMADRLGVCWRACVLVRWPGATGERNQQRREPRWERSATPRQPGRRPGRLRCLGLAPPRRRPSATIRAVRMRRATGRGSAAEVGQWPGTLVPGLAAPPPAHPAIQGHPR